MLVGCGPGRLAAPAGELVPDPDGFAAGLRAETRPLTPEQITFAWRLDEQGSRVRGMGAVRTEAAERIRLDLFGPRGETYLVAALVGSDYRLPAEADNAVALPSPTFLWAALGVLQPPLDASLTSATSTGDRAELRYETPAGEVFAYSFERLPEGSYRLVRLEREGRRGIVETVSLEYGPEAAISRTHYRNWADYRDLTLEVESIRTEDSFPPDIWRPGAVSR